MPAAETRTAKEVLEFVQSWQDYFKRYQSVQPSANKLRIQQDHLPVEAGCRAAKAGPVSGRLLEEHVRCRWGRPRPEARPKEGLSRGDAGFDQN